MELRFRSLTGVLVLIVSAIGFPYTATAEPASSTIEPSSYETIAETFNRAYFKNDPNFFRNRSLGRQLDLILGVGGFPEKDIRQDAELVDTLYRSALLQQVSSDRIIRTPDLPNPYETSILQSPGFNVNSPVEERQLIFKLRSINP